MNDPTGYAVLRLKDAGIALAKAADAVSDDCPHEAEEWLQEAVNHMWKAHCAIQTGETDERETSKPTG